MRCPGNAARWTPTSRDTSKQMAGSAATSVLRLRWGISGGTIEGAKVRPREALSPWEPIAYGLLRKGSHRDEVVREPVRCERWRSDSLSQDAYLGGRDERDRHNSLEQPCQNAMHCNGG